MPHPARALSIRQPWAALILTGHKPVENRTWTTPYRGILARHTGKRPDLTGLPLPGEFGIPVLHTGAYLGWVDLTDIHHADECGGCSDWAEPGRWHLVLTRPRLLPEPIPAPGRLGLFTPPAAVLDSLTA